MIQEVNDENTKTYLFKKEGKESFEITSQLSERFRTIQKNLVQVGDASSSSDILERVTQDYINAHHLSKSYVEKHAHLQEMYFTLSKMMLLYQEKRGDDSRILEYLMRLVKNANVLSGDELDQLISEQKQIMDDTKTINDKIDDDFFSEKNILFRDLSDEQKEYIKHSSVERQSIAKKKMQDLHLLKPQPSQIDPQYQHLFDPVLDSFYRTFYNEDQTSFLVREITMRTDRKTVYDLLESMNTFSTNESKPSSFQFTLPIKPQNLVFIYAEMAFKIVPLRIDIDTTCVYIEKILADIISSRRTQNLLKELLIVDTIQTENVESNFRVCEFKLHDDSGSLNFKNDDIIFLLMKDKSTDVDKLSLVYCLKTTTSTHNVICYIHTNLKVQDKQFFLICSSDLLEFLNDNSQNQEQEQNQEQLVDKETLYIALLVRHTQFNSLLENVRNEKNLHYLLRETFPVDTPTIVPSSFQSRETSVFKTTNERFLFICAALFFYVTHSISGVEKLVIPRKKWFQSKLNLFDIKAIEDERDTLRIPLPEIWLEVCFQPSTDKRESNDFMGESRSDHSRDDIESLQVFIEQFISTSDKVWFAKSMTNALATRYLENMILELSFEESSLSKFFFVLIPFFYQSTNYFYQYEHVSLSFPCHLLPYDDIENTLQKLLMNKKGSSWDTWISTFSSGSITIGEQQETPNEVASKLKQFLRLSEHKRTEKSVVVSWSNEFMQIGRKEVSLLLNNCLLSNPSETSILNQDILYGKYPSLQNFVRFYFYISLCNFLSINQTSDLKSVEYYFELASQCLLKIKHPDIFASYFKLLFSQTERSKASWMKSISECLSSITIQLQKSFKTVIRNDGKSIEQVDAFYIQQINKLMAEHPEIGYESNSAKVFYDVTVKNLVNEEVETNRRVSDSFRL